MDLVISWNALNKTVENVNFIFILPCELIASELKEGIIILMVPR